MGIRMVKLTERRSGRAPEEVYVNPSAVVMITPDRDGAAVRIVGEEDVIIRVDESPESVVSRLAGE